MARKPKSQRKRSLKRKKSGKSLFRALKKGLLKSASRAKLLFRNYINQQYLSSVLKLWPLQVGGIHKLRHDVALKLGRKDFEFLKRSKMLLRYTDGTWAIRGFSKVLPKPKSYKKQTWEQWKEDHFPRLTKQELACLQTDSFISSAKMKLAHQYIGKSGKGFAQLGYQGLGFGRIGMISVGKVNNNKVEWVFNANLSDIKKHHIIVKRAPEQKMIYPSRTEGPVEVFKPVPFKMPKGEGVKGKLTPIQKKEVEMRKFIQTQSQHYTFQRFAAPFLNKWMDSYAKKPTMAGLKALARFIGQQNRYGGFKRYSYPFLRRWVNAVVELI